MASLLHKLLKKPPPAPLRILSAFDSNPQLPTNYPGLHQSPIYKAAPNPPLPNPKEGRGVIPPSSFHRLLQIYPSFPHAYHLEPIPPPPPPGGPDRGAYWGDEGGDSTVWADSVKKKRKRKMNKHKYKKLRKRLRRKT